MHDDAFAIAERVARATIPDLAGVPLYIVQPRAGDMITPNMMGNLSGCFFPALDLALKPELRAAGRWEGPGLAVLVDAERIARAAVYSGESAVVGMVLHEICHALDRDRPATESPGPQASAVYEKFVASRQRTPEPARIPSAFWSHGESFTRLCCHVWFRATHGQGGRVFSARHLVFGADYPGLEALSRPLAYIESLVCELEHCSREHLRAILATAPPAAFSELWQSDVEHVFEAAASAA